jgi:hypothetical protein
VALALRKMVFTRGSVDRCHRAGSSSGGAELAQWCDTFPGSIHHLPALRNTRQPLRRPLLWRKSHASRILRGLDNRRPEIATFEFLRTACHRFEYTTDWL